MSKKEDISQELEPAEQSELEQKRAYHRIKTKECLDRKRADGTIKEVYEKIKTNIKNRYNNDEEFHKKINEYYRQSQNKKYKDDTEFRDKRKETERKRYQDPENREKVKARTLANYYKKKAEKEALEQCKTT